MHDARFGSTYGRLQVAANPDAARIWRDRYVEPEQEVFDGAPERVEDADECEIDFAVKFAAAVEQASSPRDWLVLAYRYQHEMTLDEVGSVLGVTRERVRQIEARALRRMRGAYNKGMFSKLGIGPAQRP